MDFVNKTGKDQRVKIIDKQEDLGFRWIVVLEGQSVDLPRAQGLALGFKYGKVSKEENKEIKQKRVTQTRADSTYKKKLLTVQGVGNKTAEDIMEIYPAQKDLKGAIKNKKEIPVRDDIAENLKKVFK